MTNQEMKPILSHGIVFPGPVDVERELKRARIHVWCLPRMRELAAEAGVEIGSEEAFHIEVLADVRAFGGTTVVDGERVPAPPCVRFLINVYPKEVSVAA